MSGLEEVLEELRAIRSRCESRMQEVTWDQAFVEIFNLIKTDCENEFIMHRENETGSEKHIEDFSKRLLNSLVKIKKDKDAEVIGLKSNLRMLGHIIDKFSLIQKNREDRKSREERDIRNTGERPKTAKEKRGE